MGSDGFPEPAPLLSPMAASPSTGFVPQPAPLLRGKEPSHFGQGGRREAHPGSCHALAGGRQGWQRRAEPAPTATDELKNGNVCVGLDGRCVSPGGLRACHPRARGGWVGAGQPAGLSAAAVATAMSAHSCISRQRAPPSLSSPKSVLSQSLSPKPTCYTDKLSWSAEDLWGCESEYWDVLGAPEIP